MGSNASELVKRVLEVLRLKRTYRTGWNYFGYGPPESIAAHSFGVIVLTLLIGEELLKRGKKLDLDKAIKMAILHDIGESRLGDLHLEARRLIGKEAVQRAEEEAIREVLKDPKLVKLWREFEKGESFEARFVRAMDKLELLFEAYERSKNPKLRVQEIFDTLENRKPSKDFEIVQEIIRELENELG